MESTPTLATIQQARQAISDVVEETPLIRSHWMSEELGLDLYLKLELLQRTGSFKIRGALNKIRSLSQHDKKKGVLAASAGNHAQGVALASRLEGIAATIVMPKPTPMAKLEATKGYGAQVILAGQDYEEAYREALRIQEAEGQPFIHPFDDPLVMSGQGTLGLEIHDQLPEFDVLVVPIGGGGLISGIAVGLKALRPDVGIYGVQAEQASSAAVSFQKGRSVSVEESSTIAEGIAVKQPGELTFPLIQRYVDDVVTVSENALARGIVKLMELEKIMAEAAGAASLSAILAGKLDLEGKRVVLLISGGNIDITTVHRIINRGMAEEGRFVHITATIPDRPGELTRLLGEIAALEGNIFEINHDRFALDIPINSARVNVLIETKGPDQGERIRQVLREKGYC